MSIRVAVVDDQALVRGGRRDVRICNPIGTPQQSLADAPQDPFGDRVQFIALIKQLCQCQVVPDDDLAF